MSGRDASADVAQRYVGARYPWPIARVASMASVDLIGASATIRRGRYRLKVIDIYRDPKLTGRDQIVAVPTLVKTARAPARTVVGDLCAGARVLAALQIPVAGSAGS